MTIKLYYFYISSHSIPNDMAENYTQQHMNHFLAISQHRWYPWVICISGLFILLVINGLTTTVITVFDKSLIDEFHWTHSELKLRDSIPNAVAFSLIFFSGYFIDKYKVKRIMLVGTAILSIALLSYSFISSKYEAYFLHFLFGLAYTTAGSVATIILVSSWFKESKGLALGITLAGTSLGGFIFPSLIGHWIDTVGWRQAFTYLSVIPAVLFFYILLVIRSSPNETVNTTDTNKKNENNGLSYQEATRTRTFWLICISGFLTFYSVVGIVSNTVLHCIHLGYNEQTARLSLTMYYGVAFMGKLVLSYLSDFIDTFLVFTLCCIGLTVGALGFASMIPWLVFPMTALIALSWGGIYSLYSILTLKTFGLKAAGKINGTINMFESAGAFLGPIVMATIFDYTSSYQMAFLASAFVMAIASVFSLQFKRLKPIKSPDIIG